MSNNLDNTSRQIELLKNNINGLGEEIKGIVGLFSKLSTVDKINITVDGDELTQLDAKFETITEHIRVLNSGNLKLLKQIGLNLD